MAGTLTARPSRPGAVCYGTRKSPCRNAYIAGDRCPPSPPRRARQRARRPDPHRADHLRHRRLRAGRGDARAAARAGGGRGARAREARGLLPRLPGGHHPSLDDGGDRGARPARRVREGPTPPGGPPGRRDRRGHRQGGRLPRPARAPSLHRDGPAVGLPRPADRRGPALPRLHVAHGGRGDRRPSRRRPRHRPALPDRGRIAARGQRHADRGHRRPRFGDAARRRPDPRQLRRPDGHPVVSHLAPPRGPRGTVRAHRAAALRRGDRPRGLLPDRLRDPQGVRAGRARGRHRRAARLGRLAAAVPGRPRRGAPLLGRREVARGAGEPPAALARARSAA